MSGKFKNLEEKEDSDINNIRIKRNKSFLSCI